MNKLINKLIVIKVGSSTLTKVNKSGRFELDKQSFRRLGRQVTKLQDSGYSVVIVSSSAISAGMAVTNMTKRPANNETSMPTLQALASIGWRHVLNMWASSLKGAVVGELLITKNDLKLKDESTQLVNVTYNLLKNGYIAVVNENDAITHEEIAFGDNDTLSALFASKLKQSGLFKDDVSLVILSDVDGVYEDSKKLDKLIPEIKNVSDYEHLAGGVVSKTGTGGMVTKFAAAAIATSNGVNMYIGNGRKPNVISRALEKKTGTYFQKK